MLGDIVNTDPAYTGEQSSISLSYFRDKALQFQAILNSIDTATQIARDIESNTWDDTLRYDMQSLLSDYDQKRTSLKLAAEGINIGAAAINASGGRFPSLSLPGLALAPIALTIPTLAAFAAVGALIVWGRQYIDAVNQRMKIEIEAQQAIAAASAIADPDARDKALAEVARIQAQLPSIEAAAASVSDSPLANIASVVKWVSIAALGFFIYRSYRSRVY